MAARMERNDTFVSFAGVVCGRMTTALSARRPCAGAVPGRWGACLAVRTPPAACFHEGRFFKPASQPISPVRARHFAAGPRYGGRPGVAGQPRGQSANAAINQTDLDTRGVSRRGPGRIAIAQKRCGLDLEYGPGPDGVGSALVRKCRNAKARCEHSDW